MELWHVLAIEEDNTAFDKESTPDIEDIVSACVGLLTVDEKSGIIRLVHRTTREYFESCQKMWFPDAELTLVKT